MPSVSKLEVYAAIRRDPRAGMAKRAILRKDGVGFRTIQQTLASAWPEPSLVGRGPCGR